MNVTEELADWEDSRSINRKRQWFSIDEALQQLALHKPVQRRYLQQLKNSRNTITPIVPETTALNPRSQIPESSSTTTTTNSQPQQTTIQQSNKTATAI